MTTTTELPKRAYTCQEVAHIMSVSERHIRRMVKNGTLQRVPHMGHRIVIPLSELERVFGVQQ